jgi:hypothetical protein
MKVTLLTKHIRLGDFEVKILDESMGVVGGLLHPTKAYLEEYQSLFREHLVRADFKRLAQLQLKAITQQGEELKPEGGIVITDVAEYANEITVEVCGLDREEIKRIKNS